MKAFTFDSEKVTVVEQPGKVEGFLRALKGMGSIDISESEYKNLKNFIDFPVKLMRRPGFVTISAK